MLTSLMLALPSFSNAQSAHSTTFDDRQICEKNKGIWREFGNGCGDNCDIKFDQYKICTSALTYACDCGKGHCWHDDKCLSIESYKKIFDEESEEQEKLLEAKAKERQERIKNDPALNNYLQNLYVQKDAAQAAEAKAGQNTTGQAAGQNKNPAAIVQAAPARNSQQEIASQPGAITQIINTPASGGNDVEIKIPPAFLEQQRLKEGAGNTGEPIFPVIPLPQ